ncbi:hypothetical protein MKZ38_000174 [Zalerion maritima]|uniref:Pentatricopeptide repeat-containing protein n=1 Tax=Zalerion maritima TaxID=339359 RepID=A0AAD5WS81_9PEZI|nr:hypothetical protein MKZ38_000174 [Zalerion maritima]
MIERTAASLEPLGIHRAITSPAQAQDPLTSRRRLHTAFWHHSAADLEISSIFQVLVGASNTTATHSASSPGSVLGGASFSIRNNANSIAQKVTTALVGSGNGSRDGDCDGRDNQNAPGRAFKGRSMGHNAGSMSNSSSSPFLLDFLYPNGIFSGMSRLYSPSSWHLDRSERQRSRLGFRLDLRSYTSHTSSMPTEEEFEKRITAKDDSQRDAQLPEPKTPTEKLQRILDQGDLEPASFEVLIDLWRQIPPNTQDAMQSPVLIQLCHASTKVEHTRVVKEFLLEIPRKRWTRTLLSAAIHAHIKCIEPESEAFAAALDIFHIGLKTDAVGGLGTLISYYLEEENFKQLVDLVLESDRAMVRRGVGLPRQNFAFKPKTRTALSRFKRLIKYIRKQYRDLESRERKVLEGLINSMAGRFAEHCPGHVLERLMDYVSSQKVVHKVLMHHLEWSHDKEAMDLYDLYRRLPGVRVNTDILHAMFDVYERNDDPTGFENVLADWRQHHKRLSIHAYTTFLTSYARRGDLRSTELLFNEFVNVQKQWIEAKKAGQFRDSTFTFMLNVYAERGDLSDAQRFFREMSRTVHPNQVCWNILLKAHRKVNDYAGAVEVFRNICERFQSPTIAAVRMMVDMAGARGDLDFVLSLVNDMRTSTGRVDMKMMGAVVEALCQNERFQDAEEAAINATREVSEGAVFMWNVLLEHSAIRRDLGNVSRLLGQMSEMGVKNNSDTYAWCLRALAYCKQTQHALRLLMTTIRDDVSNITADHFLIVLSSTLGTHDLETSLKTLDLMRSPNIPKSTVEILSEVSALNTWRKFRADFRDGVSQAEFVSSALAAFRRCIVRLENTEDLTKRELVRPADVEKMVVFCVLMKNYATAQDLVDAFRKAYPQDRYPERYTHQVYNALLVAYTGERDFINVDRTWETMFQTMKEEALVQGKTRKGNGPMRKVPLRMVASFQYPLTSMLRSCLQRNDPQRLTQVVRQVRQAGFELNNLNWNFYIQYLARMEQHKDAVFLCEKILMPGWVGWHNRIPIYDRARGNVENMKIPLPTRQQLRSRLYLSPSKFTILTLSKSLTDAQAASSWSTSASRYLNEILANSGRVQRAIRSLGNLFMHEIRILSKPAFYAKNISAWAEREMEEELNKERQRARLSEMMTTEQRTSTLGTASEESTDELDLLEKTMDISSPQTLSDRPEPDSDPDGRKTDVEIGESAETESTPFKVDLRPLTGGNDDYNVINMALLKTYKAKILTEKDGEAGVPAMKESADGKWDLEVVERTTGGIDMVSKRLTNIRDKKMRRKRPV